MVTATFDYSGLSAAAADDPNHPTFKIGYTFYTDAFSQTNTPRARDLSLDYHIFGTTTVEQIIPGFQYWGDIPVYDDSGSQVGTTKGVVTVREQDNFEQVGGDASFGVGGPSGPYAPTTNFVYSQDKELRFVQLSLAGPPQFGGLMQGPYTVDFAPRQTDSDGHLLYPTIIDDGGLEGSFLEALKAIDDWIDSLSVTHVDLLYHGTDPSGNDIITGEVPVTFSGGGASAGEILHSGDTNFFPNQPIQPLVTDAVITGTNFTDTITGFANGPTKFIGTPGDDTMIGGFFSDTFDLTNVPKNVEQMIHGNGLVLPDHSNDDTLILPGSANQYLINVDFYPSIDGHQAPVGFTEIDNTQTEFDRVLDDDGNVANQVFMSDTVEVVKFAEPVNNTVTLYGGHVASEMLELTAEVYGVNAQHQARDFHTADPLAYGAQGATILPNPVDEPNGPLGRGWHPMEAMELGLQPADYHSPLRPDNVTLYYSLVDGYYQATDSVNDPLMASLGLGTDRAEDDALVLSGIVDGKRTIAISFAGTDQLADMTGSFEDFGAHYDRVKPLVDAVKAYANDPSNGIQQILVSGHSLGAGIAQYAVDDLWNEGLAPYEVHAYTAGSPGSDDPDQQADFPILNLIHLGDPVTLVPYLANTAARLVVGGLLTMAADTAAGKLVDAFADLAIAANGGSADLVDTLKDIIVDSHNKTRVGTDIYIDTPFGGDGVTLQKHNVNHYVSDLVTLQNMANEQGNLFKGSALAASLRGDTPYTGPNLNISLGTEPDPNAAPNSGSGDDKLVAGSDTEFALGGGGDDQITAYGLTKNVNDRQIDGGSGINYLVLPEQSQKFVRASQSDSIWFVSSGSPIATLHNIQFIMFPNDVDGPSYMALGNFTLSIQTPAPGQIDLVFDPSKHLLDARGTGVTHIDASGSTKKAIIFVDGNHHVVVSGSNLGDLIAAGPASPSSGNTAEDIGPVANADDGSTGVTFLGGTGDDQLFGGNNADVLNGGGGDDLLNGGGGTNALTGGAGSDTFAFDSGALNDAQSGVLSHVLDFDQGNAGLFSTDEADQIDVSAIVSAAFENGAPASALVRVVADPSNADVLVQVDPDGTSGQWTTVALLDRVQASHSLSVLVDPSSTGSVQISVLSDDGHFGDFDGAGGGQADLVWRNDDGSVATWQMNGGTVAAGNFLPTVPNDWHILDTADFNADGKTDILWQNDNGSLLDWQMASSAALDTSFGIGTAPANSVLAGLGDVDGDHKADLFWRDLSTGAVTVNTIAGASNTIAGVGNDWQVVGVGDYNGDGTADVMFRNQSQGVNAAWLMNGTNVSTTVFFPGVPNDWHVVGTGDFNGNGTADLFWHNDGGANAVWLLDNSGGIQAGFFSGVGPEWHVVGTGDFNGDHKDDVIWRSDGGATAVWQMNGTNAPTVSFPGGVPTDWATQAHHYEYV